MRAWSALARYWRIPLIGRLLVTSATASIGAGRIETRFLADCLDLAVVGRGLLLRDFCADDQGEPAPSCAAVGVSFVALGGVVVAALCLQPQETSARICRLEFSSDVASGDFAGLSFHHVDTGGAVDTRCKCDFDRLHGSGGHAVPAVLNDRRKDHDARGGRNSHGTRRGDMAHCVGLLGEPADVDGRHHLLCVDVVFCLLPRAGSREPRLPEHLVVCRAAVRRCRSHLLLHRVLRRSTHDIAGSA